MTIQLHTIDVGIDLGTTNSAAAVFQHGSPVVVLNPATQQPTTPSVVRIRRNGALDVGQTAYQQLFFNPGDVRAEFKRAMGDQSAHLTFASSGRVMTPAELSAEVLKSLRGALQYQFGITPRAAVITVPAAFDLSQCSATQEAATLAGFEQAPLLQEPVAASLAYGYSADITSGSWLVYDLGGGTFDLALVGVRDGRIQVLDHEGDNFLGGKDFDWLIVEQLLVPRLAERYNVTSFTRADEGRRPAMALLKAKAEELKIALSATERATVTIESGRTPLLDDRGDEIEEDIHISRVEYEALLEAPTSRTIEMCRRLLGRNASIRPDHLVLVGGPTITPYVRTRLQSELGVPLDTSANPMTAVSAGAAIFAASQPLARAGTTHTTTGPSAANALDIRHAPVTEDSEASVGIRSADSRAVSLVVRSADGGWSSGSVALTGGAAVLRVPLLQRGANEFHITVTDESGLALLAEPDAFVIQKGLTAGASPLSRSIGVVVRDEGHGGKAVDWLLKRGSPLPAAASYEFRTTLALEPGGEIEVIGVYLVEGEARRPERNRQVGRIEITDRDVPRMVPAGAPIEVRLEVSASRLLRAKVFLPSTDQEFDVQVQMDTEDAAPASLARQLLEERQRIDDSAAHVTGADLERLRRQAEAVAAAVHHASSEDAGSQQQALMALKALQEELDRADLAADLPRAVDEARDAFGDAARVTSTMGSESQQRRTELLGRDLDAAIASGDLASIERVSSKIRRLDFEVRAAQPWFWREWFEYLSAQVSEWRDPVGADEAVRLGTKAIRDGDVSTLRRATIRLADLAPDEASSFTNVGLRRG